MTVTTILPRSILSAAAPVLAEAVALLCVYCGNPDNPIVGDKDSRPVDDGRAHLECYFQGGYGTDFEPVDPDALYDLIGDR